jgi:hypothetical protein
MLVLETTKFPQFRIIIKLARLPHNTAENEIRAFNDMKREAKKLQLSYQLLHANVYRPGNRFTALQGSSLCGRRNST